MKSDNEQKSATLGGEVTCIKVTRDTKAKLVELGKKGDTYEVVITRLLDNECSKINESENDS